MKCLLISLFLFSITYALPIGSSVGGGLEIENPCSRDALYVLRYYQPYPSDETKYIECNPWGFYVVRSCESGFKWNSWLMSCVRMHTEAASASAPVNVDKGVGLFDVVDGSVMGNRTMNQSSCSYYGNNTCLNGGICNVFLDGFSKCFCLSNFSGDYCQIKDPLSKGVFGELINSTFSLDLYKKQRPLLNDSLDLNMTIDTSIQWDDATRQKIQHYLSLYPNGTMRFDVLINYLVEDFISQIYPSAFYLQEFNYPSELQTGLSGAIPNLLMTSKYSFDNFKSFMSVYDSILDNIVEYLMMKEPSIQNQAQLFYEVYEQIFQSMDVPTSGMESNKTDMSREEMIEKMCGDYNMTLAKSYELFKLANRFDDELAIKGENYTTEEIVYAIGNFSLSPEVVKLMTEIHTINSDIWDSLSFYGFWYVLSSYVVVPAEPSSNLKAPYNVQGSMDSKMKVGVRESEEGDSDEGEESQEYNTTPMKKSLMEESTTKIVKRFAESTTRVAKDLETTRVPKDIETTRHFRDIETTRSIRDVETTRVPKDLESTRVPKDLESTRVPKSIETTRVPKDIETTRSFRDVETTRVPKDLESTRVPKDLETTRVPKDIETTRSLRDVETTRIAKDLESTRVPKDIETTRSFRDVETTRVPKDIETTRKSREVLTTRVSKDLESTRFAKSVETTRVQKDLDDVSMESTTEEVLSF